MTEDKALQPDADPPPPTWPNFMAAAAHQDYLPAEAGILEAARQGYSHWYIDGSLQGERPSDWPAERIAALNALIATKGVKPIYHGNFKAPLGYDVDSVADAGLSYVKEEVDLCVAFGGSPLIVHGGGIVEPRRASEARRLGLQRLILNLRELVAYSEQRGVQIWLENLIHYKNKFHPFYNICTTEDEIEEVLASVPGLYLFLDVSHAYVNEGDPLSFFKKFSHRVVGMSFSDNRGDHDSHFPLGRGTLDFAGLLAQIEAIGWQGMIGFETRGGTLAHGVNYLNSLARTAD